MCIQQHILVFTISKQMANIKENYIRFKGKGEHSVFELEKIIEQREEELHLLKTHSEFEKFKKMFDESFGKVIPKEFIQRMENLGYEFEDVKPTESKRVVTAYELLDWMGKRENKNRFEKGTALSIVVNAYEKEIRVD